MYTCCISNIVILEDDVSPAFRSCIFRHSHVVHDANFFFLLMAPMFNTLQMLDIQHQCIGKMM